MASESLIAQLFTSPDEANITRTVDDYDTRDCLTRPPVYLVSEFERNFKCSTAFAFAARHTWLPWITVALYLASVRLGVRLMDLRAKPFNLRWALIAWNGALAVFSTVGAMRMTVLFHIVYEHGLRVALLNEGYPACRGHCLWPALFLASKFVELGDTAFIVLRRRPVTFLHVYHHSTVLLFTYWIGIKSASGLLPQYMGINYFIHSLMYSYYACMAYGVKVPKKIAIAITCAQISQMFYGVWITVAAYQYTKNTGVPLELKVALWIYASYALLFINFFVQAYFLKPKSRYAGKQQPPQKHAKKVQYTIDGQKIKAN